LAAGSMAVASMAAAADTIARRLWRMAVCRFV
jgi:hypothetical protein